MTNNLLLPRNFVELNNEEMMYVDGGIFNRRLTFILTTRPFINHVNSVIQPHMSAAAVNAAVKAKVFLVTAAKGTALAKPTLGLSLGLVAAAPKIANRLTNIIVSNMINGAANFIFGSEELFSASVRSPINITIRV